MSNLDEINVPIRQSPRLMEITIKPLKKEIVVKQKWKFIFLNKKNFEVHVFGNSRNEIRDKIVTEYYFTKFKEAILKIWNNKFYIIEQQAHTTKKYKLTFEIETVESGEHWEVFLYLFNKNPMEQETTDWDQGKLKLYLDSMNNQKRIREIGVEKHKITAWQVSAAHEFGHSLGNVDEYHHNKVMPEHEFRRGAYNTLMNIGNELETKYVYYIVLQLSKYLARNAKFSAIKI